ncbi:uncharacterized protein LOC120353990 isoform X1 [Nilaparvata lugens]|uniref:uncharacterized protein LOC120353380 isoform X1 n=2 Tax=Nilaparvata lugens TaxID=108931 RepID=UPI00193E0273|nr:uncharacterized protein LOC120353380 isoform X1 [Nilaparvata lugens]XP_039295603.1 uncharacterized protein LOC120353990 isoform X1 [Nilaparvata lugens]
MDTDLMCCRCCPLWMGDMCGRRSGLLFNLVGNVLGFLVSGARWYGLSLYLMDVVLGLADDVDWFLSAFGGVRRDSSLDILGGRPYPVREWAYGERLSSGFLSERQYERWGFLFLGRRRPYALPMFRPPALGLPTDLPLGCSSPPPVSKINHPVHWDGNRRMRWRMRMAANNRVRGPRYPTDLD